MIGTPFHDRVLASCASLSFRDWAGYYAPASYETSHEHEYHAIRTSVAVIDVSPLFKYIVTGRDAAAAVNRVITRDAARLEPGQVIYTPWCDDAGHVIDDGTVTRLTAERFRWTAAEPNLTWIERHAAGLDARVEDASERLAALAVQGPLAAALLQSVAEAEIDALKYFRVTGGLIANRVVEISRTGYTGDLGYEIWIAREDAHAVWDAIVTAGVAFGLKPAGLLALDIARIEAGLLLIDVDFFSVRKALTASQLYTPYQMGMDRLVDLRKDRFVGRQALVDEHRRGPARRVVGVTLDWPDVERLYDVVGLPPQPPATASRLSVPVYAGAKQVGRMTSSTWSPTLKQFIGLATIDAPFAGAGSHLEVEHTVDAVRHRVGAVVTPTPFFNPKRKTQTPISGS